MEKVKLEKESQETSDLEKTLVSRCSPGQAEKRSDQTETETEMSLCRRATIRPLCVPMAESASPRSRPWQHLDHWTNEGPRCPQAAGHCQVRGSGLP